ncbi:hypothetical protein EC026C_50110 [Escherichia coli]
MLFRSAASIGVGKGTVLLEDFDPPGAVAAASFAAPAVVITVLNFEIGRAHV